MNLDKYKCPLCERKEKLDFSGELEMIRSDLKKLGYDFSDKEVAYHKFICLSLTKETRSVKTLADLKESLYKRLCDLTHDVNNAETIKNLDVVIKTVKSLNDLILSINSEEDN